MPDTDLNNDRIKVVQYTIVSIRDEGKVFPGFPKTKVVSERLTDDAFAVWVVADYLEKNSKKIPHKDKKYLRVCYDVLCSYEKSDPNYQKEIADTLNEQAKAQKEQVKVLKQIEDQLAAKAERERIQQSILAELNKGELLTADQLSQRLNLSIDTVQQGLNALTAKGEVGEWRNLYGLSAQIQESETTEADILRVLNEKGDFQTAEQLVAATGHELDKVTAVLGTLVADNVVQQKGDRYGLPEWSQNLDALGKTILQVLQREGRTLTESRLAQETQKPLASVKESLRQLVAAAEVARHGSRYGLPTW